MNAEALIGTVLGTSKLQQLIGQGGMGAVYLAQQSRPRRQVAVKVLMPATSLKPHQLSAFLERFRRETDAAASLEHPNIMPVYEYGERDGRAYLVMPYISGGTLRDVMERDVQMSFTEAVKYLEQMAAALDFAHARGVIHRDIKPANMLLTPDGRLLLTDFGLVKILSDHQSEQMRLTGAGAPVGTPDYMSPEQVIGSEVDGRADQYSLGVVLFQMLTGTTPFQGETPMQIASQQLHMQPPAPRLLRPDLPEAAEQVLRRAMAKRPDERFRRAQEFASAFRAALAEQPYQVNASSSRQGGGLFDPKWQASGTQLNAAPMASFAAQADAPRPAGTGLLSKTGFFPRVGLNENTGALPAATANEINPITGFFSTGQVPVPNGMQAGTQGFSTESSFQPTGFFAQTNGIAQQAFPTDSLQQLSPALQQPFPTGNLQQLSPTTQSTTTALSLFSTEPKTGGNTIKLTGPVKVVQVPVAPGQYVTGLLPVQKEVAGPISEPSVKGASSLQKVFLAIAAFVLLVGAGGGFFLLRSHNSATPGSQNNATSAPNVSATSLVEASATASANIIFSDPLSQNIHNFPTGNNGPKQYAFKDGAYHVLNQGNNGVAVVVQESFPQTTLGYQITMQEVKGDDTSPTNTFGVILRYNEHVNKGNKVDTFYTFEILNNNGNSQYSFYKYDSSKSTPWIPIVKSMKTGKEFHGGHGAKAVNTVKVFANGKSFTFYVNGQKVGTAQDGSLPSGSMGMLVNLKGTEVAFTNMLITLN